MKKIKIGYDDNLGLPADFTQQIECEIVSYHNLQPMLDAFADKVLDAIFTPAGSLPYVKSYELLAQSILSIDHGISLTSKLVTTKNINVSKIMDFTIGRVNQYCTTSYWAPLIYLMDFIPEGSKLNFVDTNGFVDMLDKTANGAIDCAMVWEIILKQDPQSAAKVHELGSLSNLPSPVIICGADFPASTKEKICHFNSTDKKAFFSGFQNVNVESVNQYTDNIAKAIQFYNIKL